MLEIKNEWLDEFSDNMKNAGFNVSSGWATDTLVMFSIETNDKIKSVYNPDTKEQDKKVFYDLMPQGLQKVVDSGDWRFGWGAINFNSADNSIKSILGYGMSFNLVNKN